MPDNFGTAWTDERRERALKLYKDGLSAAQIARDLGGCTRNAVIGLVHRAGLNGGSRGAAGAASAGLQTKLSQGKIAKPGRPAAPKPAPPPTPKPSPRRALRLVEPVTGGRTLQQFKSVHDARCRWPLDMSVRTEATADTLFCGNPVREDGCAYCTPHAQRAFVASRPYQPQGATLDKRKYNGRSGGGMRRTA